ncbi:selenocysteine insertion sequence-binding protein 2 [Pleurodeles waltl]|uniref:selenocysteine insertion sequence-binding protein 2 n=1 Tax=Pleurodeles waltl TaxID=8319 RepID=UPI0037095001
MQTPTNHSVQLMSWASIASLPPKKSVPSSTQGKASCNHRLNKEDARSHKKIANGSGPVETDGEETEGKRKKKRKKKKNITSSATPESPQVEIAAVQEPPKIEDDDEFPDLGVLTSGRESRFRTTRPFSSIGITDLPSEAWVKPDMRCPPDKQCITQLTSVRPIGTSLMTPRPQSATVALEKKKMQENPKPKSGGKKSKVPVQLDLGGMLAALEKRQYSDKSKPLCKPVVLSVGSAIPVHSKEAAPVVKHSQLKQGTSPHNPLDSSAPLVKKGKQREVPKAKKPSSLKKIILKEREQRKISRLQEGQDVISLDKESLPQDPYEVAEDQSASENNQDLQLTEPELEEEANDYPDNVVQSCSEVIHDGAALNTPSASANPSLPKIHSRRFREYCNQVLSKEVDSCVTDLLKELVRFQDRLFQKDPVKAKVKRRLVMGLREVLKHLKLKKLKCVIISPNCEKIQSKGGLDETLQTIIACACEQNIPFVFALSRKALGRCLNKAVPVSVVGIFSYDGAQDHFHKMCELTMKAREDYNDMISALEKEQFQDEASKNQSELTASPKEDLSVSEIRPALRPGLDEHDDEPEYIKIWKRMLEKEYDPYSMYLDTGPTSEMLNLHL